MQYFRHFCVIYVERNAKKILKKMKTRTIFCLMMILALTSLTSCESNLDEQPEVIIEPDDVPMFEFGEDGIPFRWHSPYLSAEMQEAFRKEAIGYGWRWMQTYEITYGGVAANEFYGELYGMSPSSYYIETETSIIRYFHSDTVPADAFLQSGYTIDLKTGIMTNSDRQQPAMPWSLYMRVWTIYNLSGRWYMSCVEPLCTRQGGDGQQHVVWGTSQYVRMTDAELRAMQKKHNFDYSQVYFVASN